MSKSRISKFLGGVTAAAILATPMAVVPTSQGWAQGAIIVTARRREETLQDVPISVSAKTGADLENLGITDIEMLSDFSPGLQIRSNLNAGGGRDQAQLRFRGINELITTPASRTGATFFDGAYVSSGFGYFPLFDLARTEVIKGPQNAYFARNTFTGALNMVPRLPGEEFEANGSMTIGFGLDSDEQNSYDVVVGAGGPVTDTIGVRLAGQWKREGADYEFLDGTPNGEFESKSLIGTVTWDVTPDINIQANGLYVNGSDTTLQRSVAATVNPCNRTFTGTILDPVTNGTTPISTDLSLHPGALFCGTIPDATNAFQGPTGLFDPAFVIGGQVGINNALATADNIPDRDFPLPDRFGSEYRMWRGQLKGTWDFAGGWTASILGSYGASNNGTVLDFFFGSGPAGFQSTTFASGRFSYVRDAFIEGRVRSPQENRLRGELGVSYYDQKVDNVTSQLDQQELNALGIFGSVEFDILENLTASFEFRWVDDELNIIAEGAPLSPTTDVSTSYKDFMPRAILSYEPFENTNVYFSWSQGSIQGVVSRCTSFVMITTQMIDCGALGGDFTAPQEMTSYEIGLKQQFDWLSYSIAGYRQTWENQPFTSVVLCTGPPCTIFPTTPALTVAGESEYWGAELEFQATPIEGVDFYGGVSWVDAEFVRLGARGSISTILAGGSFTGVINASGNTPQFTPEWTANMGVQLSHDLFGRGYDAYFRVDAIYNGGFFVDNFEYNFADDYWKANLRVGAHINENFRAEAFVTNVTDNNSLGAVSTTGLGAGRKTFNTLPEKREVGIRVFADF